MSKTPFVPQDWMPAPSKEADPRCLPAPIYNKVQGSGDDIERITREIEQHGVDIAPSYTEWCNLGFALATELGESGRDIYHRLSSLHADYDHGKTDKQYDNCLRSGGHGVTIRTFFYLAQRAGISISTSDFQNGKMDKWQNGKPSAGDIAKLPNIQNGKMEKWQNGKSSAGDIAKLPNIQNEETKSKWIKDEDELPTFPEEVYSHLPSLLKECVDNAVSKEDRATILLGAIACFSACFPNVKGVYDEREVFPNLYFFLVADAGMGKGALTLTRDLVAPIDRELKEASKSDYAKYKVELREYKASKDKSDMPPKEPRQLALIIPANSSAASFQKILADNDGHGLLFETEGDTLSNTLKADYGNYSDVLRKAFQHEPISYSRRTERVFEEVEHPCLSTVLAGTPGQVRRLIPDTENGLMSRFMFFHLPFKRGFRNVFAITDASSSKTVKFRQIGEKFKLLRDDFLRRGEIEFSIDELEQTQFVDYFAQTNEECCDEIDNKIQGVICRLGLVTYRIMMVLTVIRELGKYVPHDRDDATPSKLVCQTEDFETAMMIIDVLVQHTAFVYRQLSTSYNRTASLAPWSSATERRMHLYGMLPEQFSKQDYSKIVARLEWNDSTTDKWLRWYISHGLLLYGGQSDYQKVNPQETKKA